MVTGDNAIRELGMVRLQLRGDVIVTPRVSAGGVFYMVEDPLNSKFRMLGEAEYTFVSLLDGRTTIHDAISHLSSVRPDHQLSESAAAAVCQWLIESDLAHTPESSQAVHLVEKAASAEQRKRRGAVTPFTFRIPLGHPDHLFRRITPWFGWLHSAPAMVAWCILMTVGGYRVFSDWERFSAASRSIFSADNWIWLAACGLALKLLHELSHGIVCRKYGGPVRETGLMFILFAPLMYVDATSSWKFRSRWQRIHVAVAGMYIELAVAAIAAIVWHNTDNEWLSYLCANVIIMASFITVLFNANPLMKFDGYFVLSDLLGIPNLYPNGRQFVRYLGRRYLLGMPTELPRTTAGVRCVTAIYGVLSFLWSIVICVSLTIAAATLLHGAGVILAAFAITMWLGSPAWRLTRLLFYGSTGQRPKRLRFLVSTTLLLAPIVGVMCFVPWPGVREAPAVVEFSPHATIRNRAAGFVKTIHVRNGQQVEQGALLISLENRELSRQVAELELAVRQSEVRQWQHEQKQRYAEQQAEAKHGEGLQAQLAEARAQFNQLSILAPITGRVSRRDLAVLQDTYLESGTEVMTIGDEARKELRVSLAQDDVRAFTTMSSQTLRVNVTEIPSWETALDKVVPRATRRIPHQAFSAVNGGPIAVQPAAHQQGSTPHDQYEFIAPRFTAIAALPPHRARQLKAGQSADVSFRPYDESIGRHLYLSLSGWIRERFRQQQQLQDR